MLLDYQTGPIGVFIEQAKNLNVFRKNNEEKFQELTAREREVLALIAEGAKNLEIAQSLEITRATVQNHRASIREKLSIKSELDYMKFAMAYNLVQLL